jgi:heat shock protein HtpX
MYTLMSLFSIAVVTFIVGFIAIRLAGPRVVVTVFMSTLAFSIFTFLISEVVVNRIFRAVKPDPVTDKVYLDTVARISKKKWMLLKPRAYILNIGSPNAMAYGMGLPGLSAVGISRELLDLLTPEELEGVLGHEIAHIRCRDVGILTLIGLLQTMIDKFSKLLAPGRTGFMTSWFVLMAVWFLLQIAKGIFSLARFAISQERELAADALSASYQGTPYPLISALRKLNASRPLPKQGDLFDKKDTRDNNPFSDIMISHPGLDERIVSLESLLTKSA